MPGPPSTLDPACSDLHLPLLSIALFPYPCPCPGPSKPLEAPDREEPGTRERPGNKGRWGRGEDRQACRACGLGPGVGNTWVDRACVFLFLHSPLSLRGWAIPAPAWSGRGLLSYAAYSGSCSVSCPAALAWTSQDRELEPGVGPLTSKNNPHWPGCPLRPAPSAGWGPCWCQPRGSERGALSLQTDTCTASPGCPLIFSHYKHTLLSLK